MSNLFTSWHTRPLSGSSAESIFRKLSEDNNTAVTHLERNKIKYAMKNGRWKKQSDTNIDCASRLSYILVVAAKKLYLELQLRVKDKTLPKWKDDETVRIKTAEWLIIVRPTKTEEARIANNLAGCRMTMINV